MAGFPESVYGARRLSRATAGAAMALLFKPALAVCRYALRLGYPADLRITSQK